MPRVISMPDKRKPSGRTYAIVLTDVDLNKWAGRILTEDEVRDIARFLPTTVIPAVIAGMTDLMSDDDDDSDDAIDDDVSVRAHEYDSMRYPEYPERSYAD